MMQNVDIQEDRCCFVVLNVSALWIDPQASSCLSDVNLAGGTTFDKVYHVVACTGVLGIDGDMSPRSVDRR